jgi:putative transposase
MPLNWNFPAKIGPKTGKQVTRRTAMARKRYKPEGIVAKLRQVEVLVSQSQNMVDAIRQIGVNRWRQEFGGLRTEQVKHLKDLELENSRVRRRF